MPFFLRVSDLDLVETISKNLGPEGVEARIQVPIELTVEYYTSLVAPGTRSPPATQHRLQNPKWLMEFGKGSTP